MAGTKLGDAYVEISSDAKKLDRGLATAKSKVASWTDSVRGFMERIGQRLFDGLITGVRTVVDRMGAAIVASSDLAEAVNKTTVVFGSGTAEMLRWADTANTTLGMTRRQALDAAAGFGALFIQMGSTRAEAADMSQTLVELASDLSSLYNTSMDEALIKIKAGMAGETEPLRAVNIFLNEQVVQQRAVQAATRDRAVQHGRDHERIERRHRGRFGRRHHAAVDAAEQHHRHHQRRQRAPGQRQEFAHRYRRFHREVAPVREPAVQQHHHQRHHQARNHAGRICALEAHRCISRRDWPKVWKWIICM